MAISEESRHHLYQRLEQVLGTREATVLIEHLPPVGWADVATKRDLDALEGRIAGRFTLIDEQLRGIDRRFDEIDRRFGGIDRRFGEVDGRFAESSASSGRVLSALDRRPRLTVTSPTEAVTVAEPIRSRSHPSALATLPRPRTAFPWTKMLATDDPRPAPLRTSW